MTRAQLRDAARSKAIVQWFPSGRVEILSRGQGRKARKEVFATNLLTGERHFIWQGRKEYWCRIVNFRELVRLGDLL